LATTNADGHRERLRERFRKAGAEAFADHELLELLLTYAVPRRDVKETARAMLAECGDLAGVLAAPADVLRALPGVGEKTALFLHVVRDVAGEAANPARRRGRRRLRSVAEAVRFIAARVRGGREEELHAVALDAKNQPVAHTVLAAGTGDHVAVYPRKVLEFVLGRRAVGVLVAHNHPSGDPRPSKDDERLTKALEKAAAAVGVRLVDHVILGDGDRHYSFRAGLQK
jgi:DNA repair protein RadC